MKVPNLALLILRVSSMFKSELVVPEVTCPCKDFLVLDAHTIQCRNCGHSEYEHYVFTEPTLAHNEARLELVTNMGYQLRSSASRLFCTGTD